ncbi:type IV pilus assembly protein PilP [Noviherbaspirillum humi]|uniref:Type IV pilus assembly protein PilP n=1 Tax=Noviherbaspirillum humi TaxID=1688639 RepID=A0A239JH75_9BURK|nr:pilus assembly protein PilP [Noviherbaspirillum humi]SNT04643.1 type IV pilus assembly protein PilP [Noviherbaspirillum humi]
MKRASLRVLSLLAAPVLVLAGCGDSGNQEVKQWMEDVRKQTRPSVPKLAEPKQFIPFAYSGKNDPDPFSPGKLSAALAKLQANSGNGIKPDLERRKEALESFPLDTIRMVGTLERPGQTFALLQVEKSVYRAKIGNHVGQNFGRITRVTEDEVHIKEIVRDASGEWTERDAKLELQENKK